MRLLLPQTQGQGLQASYAAPQLLRGSNPHDDTAWLLT